MISTLALVILVILGILEYLRDRPNINVTVEGGKAITPKDTKYGSGSKIIVTAVNKGRRPVTLKKQVVYSHAILNITFLTPEIHWIILLN